MAEGGFLIKFGGKRGNPQRCYAVTLDYDEWVYAINNEEKKEIPKGTKKITIEIEYPLGKRPCATLRTIPRLMPP